ncbi:unnamed protein product [Parnassius apollo]|uniref:(apollo) hypothetical protein n=1 Tax=Parnassius apollo TaxID=110799 RepID=A0A8S3XL42_PARAO|nr:unnamed protein product [Parnassius apollo]
MQRPVCAYGRTGYGAGPGRPPLMDAQFMDDGKKMCAKGRCLEVAKTRLELALDATACGPPAERGVLQDHLAAPRIHHPHQKAWRRLGLLGLSKRHPPLVEHVACVGHN